jgi:hypothetical protein
MSHFIIIDTDDGLTVVPHDPADTPEETALAHKGVVADETIYATFDDAYDAMQQIPAFDDEADELE